MQIDLTVPQSEFFTSEAAYTAAVAGFGSGKTQAAATRVVASILQYPTIDQAYLAPSYGLIRDIFYPFMSEILSSLGIEYNINKGEHNIYVQGHGKIFCRTMDNPDMIVGWECGDAVMDEFDVLPKDKAFQVIRKVAARCRQKFPDGKKNQKYITTTPEGFKATYELFKKNPLPDSRLIQMSTYSNPHLPAGYIDDLKSQYPEQLIKAYLDGEFVNLVSGAVYPYFDRATHHTNRVVRQGEPLDIGVDFNVGKMSAVVFCKPTIQEDGKRLLQVVDELIGYADTPALIEAISERFPKNKITVFPDAAGKGRNTVGATTSDHKLLKAAGFSVRVLPSNPLVKDRVQSVNKLYEERRLLINTETCPDTTEATEQQVYDKNGKPDKRMDLDHPLDAKGYRICRDFLLSKPSIDYGRAL